MKPPQVLKVLNDFGFISGRGMFWFARYVRIRIGHHVGKPGLVSWLMS